jgi:hypothetical protein
MRLKDVNQLSMNTIILPLKESINKTLPIVSTYA